MQAEQIHSWFENIKGGANGQYTARCPAHDDKHNSLSIRVNPDGQVLLHCHAGCKVTDIAAAANLRMGDLSAQYGHQLNKPYTPAIVRPVTNDPETAFTDNMELFYSDTINLAHPDTVYQYNNLQNKLCFEVCRYNLPQGGKTFRQRRKENGTYIYRLDKTQRLLYRLPQIRQAIEENQTIFICEGEKDADTLVELGFCATTAPMGAGKWLPSYTEMLRGTQRVYLIPDHDRAGREHMITVGRALYAAGIEAKIIDLAAHWSELPPKGDITDYLLQLSILKRRSAIENAVQNTLSLEAFIQLATQRDLAENVPSLLSTQEYLDEQFLQQIQKSRNEGELLTGFPSLDKLLDRRLYPGLYVIGSISSMGKTAFCAQMADTIAAQGRDVLFFSLEMSRFEMTARSLVREMIGYRLHRSAQSEIRNMSSLRGQLYMTGEAKTEYDTYPALDKLDTESLSVGQILYGKLPENAIRETMQLYKKRIGSHLYLLENDGNMNGQQLCEKVHAHIAQKPSSRPVVFVDYLQILRSQDMRMTDKQAVDEAVLALKQLSHDLDIPVIAVSSFNRQSYHESVSFTAFKESGAIEYSADFVLGLQARGIGDEEMVASSQQIAKRIQQTKCEDIRPMEAVVLKNRRGKAWAKFELEFLARGSWFRDGGIKNYQ